MMTSIVVLITQMQNSKLRSSTFIIENGAQKHMVKFGTECKFYDLKYLEFGIIFFLSSLIHYILEVIITKFCRNHQFYFILSNFKQILEELLV